MTSKTKRAIEAMKITFVAKLGAMGKYEKDALQKFHVMVPKQYVDQVKDLKGKQVKVTIEDEL